MQKKNNNSNTITKKNLIIKKKNIFLFNKKMSNCYKIIPLEIRKNSGIIRHFPPANKEWINSIYSYNKDNIKYLPIKDNILFYFIKSYFNLYNSNGQKKINMNNIRMRFRRLSILKIFVSKAEIKHTSSKIIISLYVYNRQKKYLSNKINNILITNKLKERIKLIEKLSLRISEQIEKEKALINCPKIIQNICFYNDKRYKDFIRKSLEKEILTIYIKQLLYFNKSKFEDTYLYKLNNIIKKIYNKDIEFKIINIKYIYLNSDILTQSIVLKLKKRKNYVLKVLKNFFKTVKLSPLNKITLTRYFENDLSKKIIENLDIFNKLNKDNLNQTLFSIFFLNKNKKEKKINLDTLVLNSMKHKDINGLRLEAKGRLSKRRTASKSVFKLKYKGSLKNLDSSYKGLSTIFLRGHVKSNIQFTKLSSKTRNGSFGIKGWISSK